MAGGPRYEEIILSSIGVFARTNYDNATTAVLAKEAGIAEGTLYRYFPSKKELFLECGRYIERLLLERYGDIYRDTGGRPLEYLRRVAGSYLDFVRENPGMRKFLSFMLNNSYDEDFRRELEAFIDMNIRATERMIDRAKEEGEVGKELNSRVAAWMFVGGYFTLILMTEVGAEEAQDPRFLEDFLCTIFE